MGARITKVRQNTSEGVCGVAIQRTPTTKRASVNTELTRHAGGRSGQSHLPTRNQEARQNVDNSHAKPIAMGTQKGANNATLSLNKTHDSQLEFMGRLKLRNLWAYHVIEHARPREG